MWSEFNVFTYGINFFQSSEKYSKHYLNSLSKTTVCFSLMNVDLWIETCNSVLFSVVFSIFFSDQAEFTFWKILNQNQY
jgi:hypothetical protein